MKGTQQRFAVKASIVLTMLGALAVGGAMAQAIDQKPGINGVAMQSIRIGELAPLQFTLQHVWYDVTPYAPTVSSWLLREQKELMLEFRVQNATKKDMRLRWATLNFYAVDEAGETHSWQRVIKLVPLSGLPKWVADGDLFAPALDMTLRQAQTVTCRASIRVPTKLAIHKLIVEKSADPKAKVIRYDLAGGVEVGPVRAPYQEEGVLHSAKPVVEAQWKGSKDPEGEDAAKEDWYPLSSFLLRLDNFAKIEPEDVGLRADKTKMYYAATITLRNICLTGFSLSSNMLAAKSYLICENGERYVASMHAHPRFAERYSSGRVEPGETTSLRVVFPVSVNETSPPTMVELAQGGSSSWASRAYQFKVAQAP